MEEDRDLKEFSLVQIEKMRKYWKDVAVIEEAYMTGIEDIEYNMSQAIDMEVDLVHISGWVDGVRDSLREYKKVTRDELD